MSGLRRVLLHACCAAVFVSGCGTEKNDVPPLASEVNVKDPGAAALFAQAQAADSAGKPDKAIKLYEETATEFPYSDQAPQARLRQGQLLEQDGEMEDAFDAYQEVIQRYQGSALYSKALTSQAVVAYAAAEGLIKHNFLGIKSRLDSKKIVEMLNTVRDNAPRAGAAPKAQFTVGKVLENLDKREKDLLAIDAYQKVIDDYPTSAYAPEAQYHIGDILLASAARGNQNQANLDKARETFVDLIQSYPNAKRAADARKRVAEIDSRNIKRNLDIAEFYDKKGQSTSAALYYEEVVRKTTGGPMHEQAKRRLQEINASSN